MAQEIYHRSEWGNPNEQWGNVYLNADLTNELYKRASEYENSWVTDQLLNGVGIKPSIILTPTAYEDGILNSVKPAKTFGSELIDLTQGTAEQPSQWSNITTNSVNFLTGAAGTRYFNINSTQGTLISGKKYSLTLEISNYLGSYNLGLSTQGNVSINARLDANGIHKEVFVSDGSSLKIFGRQTNSATITLSVKEVTDGDFSFTRGSSATRVNEKGLIQDVQILSGELVQNGNFEQIGAEEVTNGNFNNWTADNPDSWTVLNEDANNYVTQDGTYARIVSNDTASIQIKQTIFTIGKTYKVELDAVVNSGNVEGLKLNDATAAATIGYVNSTGHHTFYFKAAGTAFVINRKGGGDTNISIDNVSVKEVGQNWDFGDDITIQDNKAFFNNSAYPQAIEQTNVATIGNKYRVKFTVSDYQSGTVKLRHPLNIDGIQANGDYVFEGEAAYTSVVIRGDGSPNNFKIDNISVVEITDDTDLPRINYTNFDYKDVLGDELVTNGSFDTDSDWSKGTGWTIADGSASYDASSTSALTSASTSIVLGKIYRLKFKITTSGFARLNFTTDGSQSLFQPNGNSLNNFADGEYTFYLSAQNNSTALKVFAYNVGGGTSFSIDNVSVKEFTEDVVVPYSGEGSLLLEPQSTNLVTYSEDFSQSVWGTWQSTKTEVNNINPTGLSGYYQISHTGSSTDNPNTRLTNVSLNGAYTLSFFVKTNQSRYISLSIDDYDGDRAKVYFDTINKTFTTVSNVGSPITNTSYNEFLNDWVRISLSVNLSNAVYNEVGVGSYNPSGSFPSASGEVISIWGAMLEQNSFSTSYIPTEGSIKTRLQDVCNNSGSSDLINSTEGVLYAEISALANDGTGRSISLSDGNVNNRISLLFGTSPNRIRAIVKSNGSTSFDEEYGVTSTLNYHKCAIKFKENDFALWIDGTERFTDTSGSTPIGLNKLMFSGGSTAYPFYGKTKCVAVFKEALSDTELQKLTQV